VKPTSSVGHTSKEAQLERDAGWVRHMHADHQGAVEATLTTCPSCLKRAEILYSFMLQSTDGPAIHVRVRCEDGHIYDVLVDGIPA
jgi:hypothetical protein